MVVVFFLALLPVLILGNVLWGLLTERSLDPVFEEARPWVEAALRREKSEAALEAFLERRRAEAEIHRAELDG